MEKQGDFYRFKLNRQSIFTYIKEKASHTNTCRGSRYGVNDGV